MQRRKFTLKLYPNTAQAQRLETWTRLHCELYNAALEKRIDAWRKARKSISYFDQQSALPEIKAALNREILSAGFGLAHPMLAYKAEEAGTRLHLSDTRQLKPSQRCSACWELVPKTLAERMHICPHCGHVMPRDQNSASVVLIDAHNTQDAPGTGVAARPKPLPRQRGKSRSVTRETPTTTAQAV